MASSFGLDAIGIGGGAPVAGKDCVVDGVGRVCGTGGGLGALLLKPISKADLRGGGGTRVLFGVVVSFVVGRLGS